LLKLLPELKEAHTIHIDAFHTYPPLPPESQYAGFKGISPWLGYGPEQECAAQGKTLRYFRDCGLDVTSEHSSGGRLDPFGGLQPAALNLGGPGDNHPANSLWGNVNKSGSQNRCGPKKPPRLAGAVRPKSRAKIWGEGGAGEDPRPPAASRRLAMHSPRR